MKNPWTKRNPFLSMWLSGANTLAGHARGRMAAAGKQQAAAMMTEGGKHVMQFWANALSQPTIGAKKKRSRTR